MNLDMEQLQDPRVQVSQGVLNWLLEVDEPSIRYETLVHLLGSMENESVVEETGRLIGKRGWAAKILERQKGGTYWDNPYSCLVPKWSTCVWQLMVLADLGVSGDDPRIRNSIDHFLDLHSVDAGGLSLRPRGGEKFEPHICMTGNMARAMVKFGYYNDERLVKAVDWLLAQQLPDGGWNCYTSEGAGSHGSFRSTVEPLWALSEILLRKPSEGLRDSARKGSEFLLRHKIFKSDRDDSVILLEFTQTHYPIHYKYDFLHALRVLTSLGVTHDPRLDDAVKLLLEKRLPDGKWALDGVYRGWRTNRPLHGIGAFRPEENEVITHGWGSETTLQLEEAGKPSKWITLQALLALRRLGLLDQRISKS